MFCEDVQYPLLQCRASGNPQENVIPQLLCGFGGMADFPEDPANADGIVQGNYWEAVPGASSLTSGHASESSPLPLRDNKRHIANCWPCLIFFSQVLPSVVPPYLGL
jgi:hypothetical protein